MDVAKVLGTFLTGAVTFLLAFKDSKIRPTFSEDPNWTSFFLLAGTASMLAAIALFFATVIAYDRLLMPLRYWNDREPRDNDALQQLMVKAHRFLFIPATCCSAVGLALLLFPLLNLAACDVILIACVVVPAWVCAYLVTRKPDFPSFTPP